MEIIENVSVKPYKTFKKVGSGDNAVCYLNKNNEVFKCYRNYKYVLDFTTKPSFIEKIEKLDVIANDTYKAPKRVLKIDGRIAGYFCDYVNAKPLKNMKSSEKIYDIFSNYDKLVEDTKKISIKNFRLRDIHELNILYKNGTFSIVDFDNGYFVNNNSEEMEDITRKNMERIFYEIVKKIFNVRVDQIPYFYDKKFEKFLHKLDPTNSDDIKKLCDWLSDMCDNANPTLSSIRRNVLMKKETDNYYNKYF